MNSAEGSNLVGQYFLGNYYENGIGIGTSKDEVKAHQWYKKSAEGENVNLQGEMKSKL